MTKEELLHAFIAWRLAIEMKIRYPDPTESFEGLAKAYGRSITTKEDLELVSKCFNWDAIAEFLEASC